MPKKYHHLTLDERTLIQTQLQQGFKPAAIAASLGRPVKAVSLDNRVNPVNPVRAGNPANRDSPGNLVSLKGISRLFLE